MNPESKRLTDRLEALAHAWRIAEATVGWEELRSRLPAGAALSGSSGAVREPGNRTGLSKGGEVRNLAKGHRGSSRER